MKKTTTILIALIIGCTSMLFSKDINFQTAKKVALNFFFERLNAFEKSTNYNDLIIVNSELIDDAYYVFNFEKGWVLVSANDVMVPVLGYNYYGAFPALDQQSDNFKSWMQHYVDQLVFIKENNIESDEQKAKWEKYLTKYPQTLVKDEILNEVEPLLTSTWYQNVPHNIYCPEDPEGPGGHAWAGCGAIAMAQIMYYWRYPEHGTGSHYYYCYPYGDQFVDFGEATYHWKAMQDNIDYNNPWEIAKIIYHAGVSVNMQYSPTGSNSNIANAAEALSTYFNYDTSAVKLNREDFTQDEWENMIKEDLNLLRPLDYRAAHAVHGGHLFVCDGFQDPNYFNFNFGWNDGNQNGFYTLEDLNGFNIGQMIVKNIFPADPDYPYIAEGQDTLSFLSGSFTDGSGPAEDYSSGMEASWLINPKSETDSVSTITLTFIQFNTAPSDYLKVYDGETTDDELIGELSGDELPTNISSSGNKMLVTFSSTGTAPGFKIEYHPSYPDYCQNQQNYTEPTGTISDGSGSFNYCNGTTCVYNIECPSAIKYNIEFTSFSTESNEDILRIYDGDENLIGEFSGSELPESMVLETSKVYITWSSNEIFTDAGWSFDYTVDFTGIGNHAAEYYLKVAPNPFTGSTKLEYSLQKDSKVQLCIYSLFGKKVKEFEMEYQSSGMHQILINGVELAGGVYFCVLKTNEGMITKKIIKL